MESQVGRVGHSGTLEKSRLSGKKGQAHLGVGVGRGRSLILKPKYLFIDKVSDSG